MDEILIDERKYVSSKQAAKVTGYAKDYIGQLCREGRVPARLVGRSWYVLETAIHDHRFGTQGIEDENNQTTKEPSSVLPPTWESPRYEAFPAEILPPLRAQEPEPITMIKEQEDQKEDKEETPQPQAKEQEIEEKEETNIAIRPIRRHFPEELLPERHIDIKASVSLVEVESDIENKPSSGVFIKIVTAISGLIAVILFALAIINLGYFDKYIVSSRQASIFTGAILYNK